MTEDSVCIDPACARRFAATPDGRCPHCGGKAASVRSMRIRGWVAIGAGIFLLAMMAGIGWIAVPMMLDPGVDHGYGTFEGSPALGLAILGFFAFIALFGLVAIRMGADMIRNGRIDIVARRIMIAMGSVFIAIGMAVEIYDDFLS